MIKQLVAIMIASFLLVARSFGEEAPELRDARQRYETRPQMEGVRIRMEKASAVSQPLTSNQSLHLAAGRFEHCKRQNTTNLTNLR